MEKTKTRAMQLDDLALMDVPTRNVSRYRDGGSWAAEVYLGDQWVKAEHLFRAGTTIDGRAATVTITMRVEAAANDKPTPDLDCPPPKTDPRF